MATLRTQFGKILKGKPSGSVLTLMTSRQKWIFQHLQFLKPFVLHRPSETSLEPEPDTAAEEQEEIEMENEIAVSPDLQQSSQQFPFSDAACGNDSPASEAPASTALVTPRHCSAQPLRRVRYRSKTNDNNIELQKIAILSKVAEKISNREDKGEYSFGKQVAEELGRIKNPTLVLRLKRSIMSQIYDAQESELSPHPVQSHPGFPMPGNYYSHHSTYLTSPSSSVPKPAPPPLLSQQAYSFLPQPDDTGCRQLQDL
ncbi:uncharacterized protein LOC107677691 [Sinocyclocheilus anshuiensis]|uniref:uncharacterized protein LOC107677691 n=1 Tax=Sinocyclocheilus anshuiensis TaxID=1608454 RepID=UPI0007B968CF|nr:PREDICTED: uncharacterized protein LOC107677691 [Sinocyclocheilus anshuiensis]